MMSLKSAASHAVAMAAMTAAARLRSMALELVRSFIAASDAGRWTSATPLPKTLTASATTSKTSVRTLASVFCSPGMRALHMEAAVSFWVSLSAATHVFSARLALSRRARRRSTVASAGLSNMLRARWVTTRSRERALALGMSTSSRRTALECTSELLSSTVKETRTLPTAWSSSLPSWKASFLSSSWRSKSAIWRRSGSTSLMRS
mmetsp:Transcript_16620/g.51529  ORF Transcript_16620/g.51529 Transcript_16620/m.51529 type:complete len:206 (-) Transcript_16620:65-682(-)